MPTAPPPNAVARTTPNRAVATRVDADTLRRQLLPRLADLLPDGTSVDRFVALTLQALAKSPELRDCDPDSVLLSALEVAQVGLEPTGSIGGAHLVGFNDGNKPTKKCQVIYDYRGLQHLIRVGGGGEVKAVLVYEGDQFKVFEGTQPRIEHEPAYATNDPSKITFVYAWPLDHPEKFEVMTKQQIDVVRASSRLKNGIPWTQHFGQQSRKTVIRRISNYLELRPQTRLIIERDTEREFGGDATEPTVTRAAGIRAKLAARREPLPDAGGDPPAPPASAEQQQDPAAQAVCGARHATEGGALCAEPPDHADSPHKTADGALIWPKEAAK